MKRLLSVLLVGLACSAAFAQLSEIGIDPLALETGARPLGMGAAFVGIADDANAALYNPGGLAWSKGIALTFKDFDNITAIQSYPTGFNSSFGLGVINSKIDNISTSSGATGFSSNVILLSYGTKINFIPALSNKEFFRHFGLGVNFKNLTSATLRRRGTPDRSATGWDIDLGALYKGTEWWSVGATLSNLLPPKTLGGGEVNWDVGTGESAPLSLKLAGGLKLISDLDSPIFMEGRELLLGGEIDLSEIHPMQLRLGGEFSFNRTYFIRTGLMQQWKEGGSTYSLNLGLGYRTEELGVDVVNYFDALRGEAVTYFSLLYFPKDWVVVKKLDVEKPAVMIDKPIEKISLADDFISYDDKIEITGKVKSGVEVYVNDLRVATDKDNNFKAIVPLQMEKNLVVVEARYEGEKKAWRYKVLRKAKVNITEEKELKQQLAKAVTPEVKAELKKQEQEISKKKAKVEELVTLGVITVTPEAEFQLEAYVTRGELATWLAKASGLQPPKVDRDLFSDVKRDDPIAPFVKLAVDLDLMRPFPDGTFRPAAPVSQEEGERIFNVLKVQQ